MGLWGGQRRLIGNRRLFCFATRKRASKEKEDSYVTERDDGDGGWELHGRQLDLGDDGRGVEAGE